jgi:uncharacterized protein (DUF3084 family)
LEGVRRCGERLSCYEVLKSITFAPYMKRIFLVSILVSFVMICSCQKKDSAAEQQLAQRKTELDAREAALNEKEKALDRRERALVEREEAIATARTIPPGVQGQVPDSAQMNAERERRIQQLPPELRALIPDRAQMDARKAEKDRLKQQPLSQGQGGPEQ